MTSYVRFDNGQWTRVEITAVRYDDGAASFKVRPEAGNVAPFTLYVGVPLDEVPPTVYPRAMEALNE